MVVGQGAADTRALFDWPEAVGQAACALVQELLSDRERLATIRARNLEAMAARHDWRLRVATIREALGQQAAPRVLRLSARRLPT